MSARFVNIAGRLLLCSKLTEAAMRSFLIFVLCLSFGLFSAICDADAKSYKLGNSSDGGQMFGKINKRICSDRCSKCSDGVCESCPPGSKPNGSGCVDYCKDVVCKAGNTPQESADKCCCVPLEQACPSGQRLRNGRCEDPCADVICFSGSSKVVKGDKCCCE